MIFSALSWCSDWCCSLRYGDDVSLRLSFSLIGVALVSVLPLNFFG